MPELARLTWQEAEPALSAAKLALVPVGSCEQHGPHLELDTDHAIAEAFARRLAADLGKDAMLCPAIPYGLSEHHLAFPGTVTLRPHTFEALLGDVIESLGGWGLKRVLIVNGHGGNIDALKIVSRMARRDHGTLVAAVIWAQLAADEIAKLATSASYGHACEIETSVAMVLAPERVHRDRIGEPGGRRSSDPLTDPPRGYVDRAVWMDEWTADGALGDPRLASEEIGKAVLDAAYTRALKFARHFVEAPLPATK